MQAFLPSVRLQARGAEYPDSFWRSLNFFNVYRLIVGGLFIFTVAIFGDRLVFGSYNLPLFYYGSTGYLMCGVVFVMLINSRQPRFNLQLSLQVGADVTFIVILMYASGGIQSGLGLLLLASLAAAGLISRGRMTLFYASLASIAVLLEQTYAVLRLDSPSTLYIQGGLLSIGFFATAWLAHTLAKYTVASEQLAQQRSIDLANMAQVNQLVIQDMQDGVMVVDQRGRVRQRNSQAEKLLGKPGPTSEALRDYSPALAERFKLWQANSAAEFDLLRVPATNRLVRTRFVPVKDSASLGAVIFLEDMSRVQAQAQQLKLAALGRLTANIAHEIRNPLSAVSHAAELLEEENGRSETQTRLLRIIRDNTQRLERMVQDVLQLNRRDRARPESFKAAAFLKTFVDEFCQVEKIPPETFSLDIAKDPALCFDRGHLNQVLWNLCRNAWHHCSKRGNSIRLRVGQGHTENSVHVDVIDDGPGVDPFLRGQLFEPFFTTVASGTGLGLYIAREICEANGAALDCIENAPGGHFRIIGRRDHVKAQRAGDVGQH